MRIRSTDTVCGFPAVKVRQLLRRLPDSLSVAAVREEMKLDAKAATALVAALKRSGYIEKSARDDQRWRTTVTGNAFAAASAAAPLSRNAADDALLEFLARVERVRDESTWCFKVERAVLFGSYLGPARKLGDVDVAVCLRKTHGDHDTQERAKQQCRERADNAGKRFPHFAARLVWPEVEVWRFLKSRSRVSVHDLTNDESIVESGPHTTIYARNRVCRSAMPLLKNWNSEAMRARLDQIAGRKQQDAHKRQVAAIRKVKQERERDLLARVDKMDAKRGSRA